MQPNEFIIPCARAARDWVDNAHMQIHCVHSPRIWHEAGFLACARVPPSEWVLYSFFMRSRPAGHEQARINVLHALYDLWFCIRRFLTLCKYCWNECSREFHLAMRRLECDGAMNISFMYYLQKAQRQWRRIGAMLCNPRALKVERKLKRLTFKVARHDLKIMGLKENFSGCN